MSEKFIDAYHDIAKSYDAQVQLQFSLTDGEGTETPIFAIMHDLSQKVAIVLADRAMPIEFDTPSGKTMWIDSWGLVHGTRLFFVDDGHTHSLGIYRMDGARATFQFNTKYNTIEVYHRIRKIAVERVGNNPFILSPKLSTLDDMPTVRSH